MTAAELGRSWRAGCPVGPRQLRSVAVSYRGFDGRVHHGRLVVAAELAAEVRRIFAALRAHRFPLRSVVPVSAYAGDDARSMAADNTSAFNCRPVTGGSGWSRHAYGRAIDVDPRENPYRSGSVVQPADGAAFLDRTRTDPGVLHAGDLVVATFSRYGWSWGGHWTDPTDYQHFEK